MAEATIRPLSFFCVVSFDSALSVTISRDNDVIFTKVNNSVYPQTIFFDSFLSPESGGTKYNQKHRKAK